MWTIYETDFQMIDNFSLRRISISCVWLWGFNYFFYFFFCINSWKWLELLSLINIGCFFSWEVQQIRHIQSVCIYSWSSLPSIKVQKRAPVTCNVEIVMVSNMFQLHFFPFNDDCLVLFLELEQCSLKPNISKVYDFQPSHPTYYKPYCNL